MADFKRVVDLVTQDSVDPTTGIRASLDVVNESLENGFNIVTAESPFMNLLEASSSMTYGSMTKANILMRRQYKKLAQSYEDLYGHLSDRDFKGRFGNPGRTTINIAYDYDWIIENAVSDPDTGDTCIILPKDTVVTVNGIDLYWHYDIKIHVLASGDIQVYFVIDRESPIYKPTSLVLQTSQIYLNGQRLIDISIPVEQLSLDVISNPITANGYNESFAITNNFYYARAFIKVGGIWKEIPTTHSEQVYDPNITTMLLKVTDRQLQARIPDIYINNNMAGTEAKLLIYTTLGNINTDLSQFQINDFTVEYDDVFDENLDLWEMLSGVPIQLIHSRNNITDGKNALTFEEMKDLVVYNKYGKAVSVTYDELVVAMNLRGYGIYKQKDTISERVFVTTKEIPSPATNFISSGPSVSNKDVLVDAQRNDINNHVINNGDVTTIKPGALLKSTGFDVVLANETEQTQIEALSLYNLCTELNENQYYFTPFYYVLDGSTPVFRTSAYYLDKPTRINTSFVNLNTNLDYAVKTKDAQVSFDGSKWTIRIIAENPPSLVGLYLQMKVTDYQGNVLHINANQVPINDTVSEFVFELNTNLHIDANHRFQCADFNDSTGISVDTFINLTQELEFVYLVEEGVVTPSGFDSIIETVNIGTTVSGVTYDKITFEFGKSLDNLNVLSKVELMPGEVATHNTDVPLYYENDVYLNDADGKVYSIDEDTDAVNFTILHNAGDPVMRDGEQVYKHRTGDAIIIDNKVQYLKVPYNARRVRLFLIDAKYKYATDTTIVSYADTIAKHVIDSLEDMREYDPEMLERTTLLFEPVSTSNLSAVTISNGRQMTAATAIKFNVRYTMDESRYTDVQLRNAIIETTKRTVAKSITKNEFSLSALTSELDKVANNVMRNVEVTTSLPGKIVRINNDSSVFSVKSRIVPTQNRQLTVEDDITIEIVT